MTAPRSTAFRYRRLASIAAGGLATALALSVAVRAWAQTSPNSSPAGECVPGRIVDFCSDVPAAQGFLLDKGVYTTIAAPAASTTIPFSINNGDQIVGAFSDRDQIVGRFNDPNNAAGNHGFLLDDGAFTPIDFPGALGTVAFGINDKILRSLADCCPWII
jgi:hypothetical protein